MYMLMNTLYIFIYTYLSIVYISYIYITYNLTLVGVAHMKHLKSY